MPPAGPARELSSATEDFIEGLGLSVQQDGLPRIAGRMLGLFIVHGGPFSFSELAEKLQVSRASVSTNTRILRQLGFIERLGRPGDRQDYYRLSDDPYGRLLDGYAARLRERLALLDRLVQALPGPAGESTNRIMRMRQFYAAALAATEELMNNFSKENP